MRWPGGKRFAFSVFDDADSATLENVGEVYAFLKDRGLRTTKSVWLLPGRDNSSGGGSTCPEREYRDWALEPQRSGFEIGWHMARFHTWIREDTLRGLDNFAMLFGRDPGCMANHSVCEENIYWAENRVSGPHRWVYHLLTGNKNRGRFRGHIEGDPLFWGDVCRQRIEYCRNFGFGGVNTLKQCPMMPYHDPRRPYVNYWYASTGGHNVLAFNKSLSEGNQDRLEEEGGCCIMYTHFACGFFQDGALDARFRRLMERLSERHGWLVPVSTLLDHLLEVQGHRELTDSERSLLERRWLLYKLRVGSA